VGNLAKRATPNYRTVTDDPRRFADQNRRQPEQGEGEAQTIPKKITRYFSSLSSIPAFWHGAVSVVPVWRTGLVLLKPIPAAQRSGADAKNDTDHILDPLTNARRLAQLPIGPRNAPITPTKRPGCPYARHANVTKSIFQAECRRQ